ncbi:hydrogenase maturation nickel metallochaperone HypA [Zavarzinia compransoris]|uniref:Hydrogenase maturation factor HypA n=1 Tax=Zavarzinia compransoris TaxID=1264899 RepID=A0A317ECR5_9PROT|nr:hydrogenase maturation nickel metallochaperone HypA [Zavarzinia compransoris]PWR23153.1 hydrogenase maturation nickel metallochaperone HypA [Zavarzinia compransoris]TDP46290.1 hydrogenase-3 nickel incorporation protein HypA [Zavarzinia compransoris]
MHEMALCESVVAAVEDQAKRHQFSRVRRVRLEIGRFAGVEIAALRFGFDVVARGTLCEGAELAILEPPGEAWCFDCSATVALDGRLDPCPACGGQRLQPVSGTQMTIKDLEVE